MFQKKIILWFLLRTYLPISFWSILFCSFARRSDVSAGWTLSYEPHFASCFKGLGARVIRLLPLKGIGDSSGRNWCIKFHLSEKDPLTFKPVSFVENLSVLFTSKIKTKKFSFFARVTCFSMDKILRTFYNLVGICSSNQLTHVYVVLASHTACNNKLITCLPTYQYFIFNFYLYIGNISSIQ